ncbi:MAG: sterol desaturase family protein [Haliea sp.]|nr:sterol desaturase family protein [Haliea sp.]
MRALLYTGLVLTSILASIALLFSAKKLHALVGLSCVLLAWLAARGCQLRRPGARFALLHQPRLGAAGPGDHRHAVYQYRAVFPPEKTRAYCAAAGRSTWRIVANHIFNGAIVFLLFLPAQWLAAQFSLEALQSNVSGLPLLVQVPLIMLVTDCAQYWVHRAFHRVPLLWRFHRIHHSVEQMDWLWRVTPAHRRCAGDAARSA